MKNVLLLDSGSGGINVLKECVKIAPYCNFLFYCDNKNMPYGDKSKEELQQITVENLRRIYTFFKFDIVIFACNTLTCTCLEKCREIFADKIFIGTVPAIKPALQKFDEKEILVLATPTTIKHNVLLSKLQNVQRLSMPTLAKDIDKHLDNLSVLRPKLSQILSDKKCKAVVLGCTHYASVKDIILNVFDDTIEIFDSANGVARRLKSFLDVASPDQNYQVQIMVSGNADFVGKLWWHYNQNL